MQAKARQISRLVNALAFRASRRTMPSAINPERHRVTSGIDPVPAPLTTRQRYLALVAAFLAWLFAGLEISLFILIHRPMMLDLLGAGVEETFVTRWFAWYQAAFLLGAAAGGWLFGWLGDRQGRTRAMGLSVHCYALFTLACYVAVTPEQLLVLRFLACLGIGGVWPNAVALVAEAWPDVS